MTLSDRTAGRLRAVAIHVALSAAIASFVAVLTLAVWYPGAYRSMSGGRQLFLLLVGVDVVIGPLLTLVVFDITKPRRELVRDLFVIAMLQLGALGYGLYTACLARPVALVLEGDRFRVVTANDVRAEELPTAAQAYRHLSFTGPLVLGTRAPRSSDEKLQSIDLALGGFDIGQRPSFWQPYAESRPEALRRSRPIALIGQRFPARQRELDAVLADIALPAADARFLPILARSDWIAILDAKGDVAGFAPFDGFF